MFHHVAEKVFLGPSAEEPARILQAQLAVGGADQARLMPAAGQLANLADPQTLAPIADPGAHLGQLHRQDFAAGHGDLRLGELGFRPILFGIFVVGDAGDAMLLPHLSEERRTVPFAIEDDHEAAEIRIGLRVVRPWVDREPPSADAARRRCVRPRATRGPPDARRKRTVGPARR